jgi:hypothetical protein
MTPAWILDILAGLMLAVAAVSAARLTVAPRRWGGLADIDVAHLLMAVAMAGMLVPSLTTLPATAWAAVFGLMTAWFAWRVWRDARASGVRALAGGHCVPHLAHSGAMLYMFLAQAAPVSGRAMSGMGGSAARTLEYPTLAFVFTLILAGYSVWDIDRLSGVPLTSAGPSAMASAGTAAFVPPPAAPGAGGAVPRRGAPAIGSGLRALLLSPGTTVACRVLMGVSMAFILVIMI